MGLELLPPSFKEPIRDKRRALETTKRLVPYTTTRPTRVPTHTLTKAPTTPTVAAEGDNLLLFTSLVEEALTRLSDSSSTPDRCRESSAEEEEQVLKLIGLERYEVFILLSEEMKRKKLELIFLPFNQLLPLPDLMLKHTYPFADKSPIKSRTSSKYFPDGKP
ncbi:unnamed protein product [Vicia faba]|uniref:Uncharacterized protein n=1 Tax=Vicia faba TaxID=3906 RepID=A0AAV1B5A2_VICFA|nr:unnamed protein product [Vicia faba]